MKSNINKLIMIEVVAGILSCVHGKRDPAYDRSTADHVFTI